MSTDEDPACPTCRNALRPEAELLICPEGHRYSPVGLALVTQVATLNALWFAIRALENDAAGLTYLAERIGTTHASILRHKQQAQACRDAAGALRVMAKRVEDHLESLPVAPSTLTI